MHGKPAHFERARCAVVRTLIRVLIVLARASLRILPKDHPSAIFGRGYLRDSKLERVASGTFARDNCTSFAASTLGAIRATGALLSLYYVADIVQPGDHIGPDGHLVRDLIGLLPF